MGIKEIFLKQKKIYQVIEVIGVLLGFVFGIIECINILTPAPSYEVGEIIKLADKFDVDSIQKVIKKTKNDGNNQDVYWFTKAVYSIMEPVSSKDDTISNIKKIDNDSKFYKYSIFLAWNYLQANSHCISAPSEALKSFANSLKEKGDRSPMVDLTYYIESTITKADYGIGDIRRFPFHENTQYILCLQRPIYYIDAYKNIKHKFESKNFKITYDGAHSLNAGLNKLIEIDLIYLHLNKLIGALHGSAFLSFSLNGDEMNAQKEKEEFLKYYPHGITNDEKKAFLAIYGSLYLYLLDDMSKQRHIKL